MMNNKNIDGEKNKIIGRDDNSKTVNKIYGNINLTEEVDKFLKSVDLQINRLFPKGFYTPRAKEKREKFDSQKLVASLSAMGFKFSLCVGILQYISSHCEDKIDKIDKDIITTSFITDLVIDALKYSTFTNCTIKEIDKLTVKYTRQYGNSNKSIKVYHRDFDESELTYGYLKNTVIPHIISRTYGIDYGIKKDLIYSSQGFEDIAEEIISKIQFLNLYAIDYRTLLGIATNIASQPPHPWISTVKTDQDNIRYNLDIAYKHFLIIKESEDHKNITEKELSNLKHSVIECIDHSCSALLHHYALFIGAGKLRPYNNLIKYLKLRKEGVGNKELWARCSINNIEADLGIIGANIDFLEDILITISRYLSSFYNPNRLPHLLNNTKALFKTVSDLINTNREIDEMFAQLKESHSSSLMVKTVSQTLNMIKGINNIQIRNSINSFHFQHFSNLSVLSDCKHIIQGIIINSNSTVTLDNLKQTLDLMTFFPKVSNCCLVISRTGYEKSCIEYIKDNYWKKHLIYLLTLSEIEHIYTSKDRETSLSEILLSFQQKLI